MKQRTLLFFLVLLSTLTASAQTDLSGATVNLYPNVYDYDGTAHCPKVSGIRKGIKRYNSLVEGTDYDISYENNIEAGQATATLVFKGDYTGIATQTYTINPMDLTREETVVLTLDVDEVNYDGTEQKPAASNLYYEGTLLVPSVDYDLSYKNNRNPGTATVTALFKGNYAGSKVASFVIKDGGNVPPSSLTVNYYDSSEANPQVEKEMTYPEFLTLLVSFPNAIAILPQGFTEWPKDKKHIVVKGERSSAANTCYNFTLTDKKDFWSSVPFVAKNFSYTRELVEGYNTCCLPFSVENTDVPEGSQIYYFSFAVEDWNQLFFYPILCGDAGYPFLIKTQEACTWNYNGSNIRIEPEVINNSDGNIGFFGTYTQTSEYKYADDNQYLGVRNSDNKFAPLANNLSPFRACILANDANTSSARSAYIPAINGNVKGYDDIGISSSTVRGDLNGDGEVGMPDVMFLIQKILNGKFPDEGTENPDVLTGLVPHAPTRAIPIIDELNPDGSFIFHYTADGYITGDCITSDVEYSINGGETWIRAETNGIIDLLPMGKVLVRIAATTSASASKAVEVIIPGNADFKGEGGYSEGQNARGARLSK